MFYNSHQCQSFYFGSFSAIPNKLVYKYELETVTEQWSCPATIGQKADELRERESLTCIRKPIKWFNEQKKMALLILTRAPVGEWADGEPP